MSVATTDPISKVKLGAFSATGFNRGAGKIKETIWYLFKMLFFLSAFPFPSSLKCWLLRMFGARVGNGVVIKPRVNIHFPWKLDLGNDVWIGEEALLLNFELLTIGNDVCVSQRAFLCGGNHNYKDPAMPYRNGAITLKDGVWVGACCFVGPGVTVGVDTVVSAGSVVTGDLNANSIYKGNPPVFIKERW
ncbi:WcaF family extracellular polysaccharide biosynthesis acetyltransferase [Mucilaginibacter agri]|uniref:Colanic acid biosynthesis acetyltransferase WcaF n=1 Tax=Mucilaginibacter agri TaxID=2695265 RepID=A0A966DSM3_9SPHI|nr:WcaF family extracellular polysaccharide biosynthesis acetyltransferase [Mucilaginibacter agri]NCD68392.1 colanic acid biosynthesis acetyltransferase WcaF [Mucilaginibacter agri]